jgi:hypothetical protein
MQKIVEMLTRRFYLMWVAGLALSLAGPGSA